MLVLLTPEQVTRYWSEIKNGIDQAMKPTLDKGEKRGKEMFSMLMEGTLQCWVAAAKRQNAAEIYGFVITMVGRDPVVPSKLSLIVYVIFGMKHADDVVWGEALDDLESHARKSGCSEICGYTEVKYVEDKALSLGFKPKAFLYKEINQGG